MKKIILICGLTFLSHFAFSQFTGTSPAVLNGSAFMSGDMSIGPSGVGISIPGSPPVIGTPIRKLNLYKDVPGGLFYPFGTPLATYTTGLKIVHRLGAYSSIPEQHYNWEMAADNNKMYFHFANTKKTIMTMGKEGKVGIGGNPDATLYVRNINGVKLDAHFEGFTLLDGNEASLLLGRQTGAPYGEWGIEYNNWSGGLNFWKPAGSNGFGNYFLFISDAGNVSIGTDDSQGYKFAVNGDMIAEKVVVKLNANWPDFVFTKQYDLMALEDVESFIKENNHLPNVPSAKEVEEGGIDLGTMDATLLQKIEELTLYVIELKKEIDVLKK